MSDLTESTEPTRVRRRGVLGISGWLLFACLFLPTLRVCGDPMAPIQFPPTYGLYLGGIAVAVIGFSTLRRTRQAWLVVLMGLYLASILTYMALWIGADAGTGIGLVLGAGFLTLLVYTLRKAWGARWSERAIAAGCVAHALIALGWSALLAFDPDGLWGATVSLGAASLMLFAAVGYLGRELAEARKRLDEPISLPAARIV